MSSKMSRRELLKVLGALTLSAPLMQACGQNAGGTQTEGTGNEADDPSDQVPEQESVTLRVIAKEDVNFTWMPTACEEWGERTEGVDIELEFVPYNEMAKHQLTGAATGTLQDVIYSGVKWMLYSAYKGAFLALDELVQANDPGIDDFIPAAIDGCKLDGKLYGLPFATNTGNTNIIFYNKTYLQEKGIEEPTDDWTVDEFVDKAIAATDLDQQIFGTSIFTSNHYDLACWIRSWGSDIFGPEAQKFNLADDPKSVAATKWLTELRTKHHIAPLRGEAEGMDFNAGHMALQGFGCYKVMPTKEAVGDKFEWDVVLAPKGPDGLRGYEVFVNALNIYSKTEYPNEAFALISHLTSEEISLQAFVDQGQLSARISVFNADEAGDVHPIFPRIGLWLSDGVNKGPFPMPANLRFSELHDTFTNYASDLFYGDVEFEAGIQTIQEECQKVMDQPRG